MKKFTYLVIFLLGFSLLFSASSSYAALVPCGTGGTACTLCHLITGIQGLVNWGKNIVIVVALVALTISGVMYMVSAGDEEMMGKAKGFMKAAILGTIFFFCAWLLVNMTFYILGASDNISGITTQGAWYEFKNVTCK